MKDDEMKEFQSRWLPAKKGGLVDHIFTTYVEKWQPDLMNIFPGIFGVRGKPVYNKGVCIKQCSLTICLFLFYI